MIIVIILSCLIGLSCFIYTLWGEGGFSLFSVLVLLGSGLASFVLFILIGTIGEGIIPQTQYYSNLNWEIVIEQELIMENDSTYVSYIGYNGANKIYVSFNVENESFGGKEKITLSNEKSQIIFHYSDTIKPTIIVEEAIPNHFIRLFYPKFYRYHIIVPEDKIIYTYIE